MTRAAQPVRQHITPSPAIPATASPSTGAFTGAAFATATPSSA
ncbi:MAG: hypothetical protein RIC49_11260 [Phycisphaerales bacterium]